MYAERRPTSFAAAGPSRRRISAGPSTSSRPAGFTPQPPPASARGGLSYPGSRQATTATAATPHSLVSTDVPKTAGIRAVDASLGGLNVRIANRIIVTTTLQRALAVDALIAGFDVCLPANLLATCVGKIVYIWRLDTLTIQQKFGRNTGSVHRENIRDCRFDPKGALLVTGADDMRVVIWNVKTSKAEKVIEAHKGIIYQVRFSEDSKLVYSCGDDGRVQVWNWRTGTLVHTFIRHPTSIRCLDLTPARLITGRADGHASAWDTTHEVLIDSIAPEPHWPEKETRTPEDIDERARHTGAILAVKASANGRLLATGSGDWTAKVWNVTSWGRDWEGVCAEIEEGRKQEQKMDDMIRLDEDDPMFQAQMLAGDMHGYKIGDAPITLGYHGDLLFTYRHDGPVLSVCFNNTSSMLITGSTDATCRLWSTRRGDLLFQINVPAPVTAIHVGEGGDMCCVCQNRVLFFDIKTNAKDEDLPDYWQRRSMERLIEESLDDETRAAIRSARAEGHAAQGQPPGVEGRVMSAEDAELVEGLVEEMKEGVETTRVTIAELHSLIKHGLVAPSFLKTLVEQFPSVDPAVLESNMKRKEIPPQTLLRLLLRTPYHPRDIFTALASTHADALFDMIRQGKPIDEALAGMGFKKLDQKTLTARGGLGGGGGRGLGAGTGGAEDGGVYLNLRDFRPRRRGAYPPSDPRHGYARPGQNMPSYLGPARDIYSDGMRYENEYDEDEEAYLLEEEMRAARMGAAGAMPRGKVLHFIPSEQMKLLRDFQANRDLKPIFLRDLVLDLSPDAGYPNFTTADETRDNRPMIAHRTVGQSGIRFNDMSTFGRMTRSKLAQRGGWGRQHDMHDFNLQNLPLPLDLRPGRAGGSSSRTLFQPSRYVRARGLNISFQPRQYGGQQGGQRLRGHVYAQPIVMRHARGREARPQQFIVGKSISMRESNIDEEGEEM
ncbi:WD40-repeat-containing domain protein [Fimicolochytrium jonesii]|uniref:WD40-repeat-containing domain protein n=1 Tax=Fimicolochytrium jonesii TaxID=1396493 RepID=UPI0022FF3EF9|nr:WD40-repeat-containing domain protein [Fimicolochytrium jonesii]KAI8823149.1 WD40-repeat-containing domain protein [Fimicolochytrium jonesii]